LSLFENEDNSKYFLKFFLPFVVQLNEYGSPCSKYMIATMKWFTMCSKVVHYGGIFKPTIKSANSPLQVQSVCE